MQSWLKSGKKIRRINYSKIQQKNENKRISVEKDAKNKQLLLICDWVFIYLISVCNDFVTEIYRKLKAKVTRKVGIQERRQSWRDFLGLPRGALQYRGNYSTRPWGTLFLSVVGLHRPADRTGLPLRARIMP